MDVSPLHFSQEDTIVETPTTEETIQQEMEGEPEGGHMDEDVEEDFIEEEDKDLLEDDLRQYHKVDSVNTIAGLRMKPDHLFRLQIPLCRMVPMPMVRPTLSCDLDLLKHEFCSRLS